MVLSKLTFIPNPLIIISMFYAVALIPPIAPKLSRLDLLLEYTETVPLTKNLSKEVKNTMQNYLVGRRYLPHQVKIQFDKAKEIPRRDLLTPKTRDKKVIFPFVKDFNPHLPNINKIISNYSHSIYSSPTLSQFFHQGSIIPSFQGCSQDFFLRHAQFSKCPYPPSPTLLPNISKGEITVSRNVFTVYEMT